MDFDNFKAINDEERHVGIMDDPTVVGRYRNESCGDDYVIYIKVKGGRVTDASFTTSGCGFGLAALSLAADWIIGKKVDEAERIKETNVEADIDGFPERRRHYPRMAVEIFRETLWKCRERAKR